MLLYCLVSFLLSAAFLVEYGKENIPRDLEGSEMLLTVVGANAPRGTGAVSRECLTRGQTFWGRQKGAVNGGDGGDCPILFPLS